MKIDTRNTYAARMLRVLNHIQRHLDEPLDLETLAGLTHFSPAHFHRVFKGMIGETVMEHRRRIRLERAWVRIAQDGISVTDAAFDAGYDSLEAFSRVFRRTFGLSPSQCRTNWERRFAPAPSGIHYCQGELVEFLFDETGAAIMNVRIETLPERPILRVRQTGPYKDSAARAWSMLCGWAGPKGLLGPRTLFFGIGHDDPSATAPEAIRYDAAIFVEGAAPAPQPPVEADILPGGDYAVVTHQGPYEKLEDTYRAVMGQWLPQSGREPRNAPCFEVYRNDPDTTPPDELLTDIHVPLK
jgi:AraC family transcriptional regulator